MRKVKRSLMSLALLLALTLCLNMSVFASENDSIAEFMRNNPNCPVVWTDQYGNIVSDADGTVELDKLSSKTRTTPLVLHAYPTIYWANQEVRVGLGYMTVNWINTPTDKILSVVEFEQYGPDWKAGWVWKEACRNPNSNNLRVQYFVRLSYNGVGRTSDTMDFYVNTSNKLITDYRPLI